MHFFVITGGPGVGKTSLIEALQSNGQHVVAEDARRIIREEHLYGGDALPWKDKRKYAKRMLDASFCSFLQTRTKWSEETIFFDRSIVDALCYMEMEGLSADDDILEKIQLCTYAPKVFILPPWEEIYTMDQERKQDWKAAAQTFDALTKTYSRLGYELVEVPKVTRQERCRFVLAMVNNQRQETL